MCSWTHALSSSSEAQQYFELAEYAGQQHGLPSGLMSALVYVESRGNPRAVSHAGAISLAQLMPSTAQELGINPWNAWENVYGGALYLSRQIKRFQRLDLSISRDTTICSKSAEEVPSDRSKKCISE